MKTGLPWHAQTVEEVVASLKSDVDQGLAGVEAGRRHELFGQNKLTADVSTSSLRLILVQFNNVLVWVLLVAAFISGVVLQEWIDTVVILAIVVLNAALGFSQESRAETALRRLNDMSAPEALVIRDGSEQRVSATAVVSGDVIVLEAGDRVPADTRLVQAVHIQTDEAILTGESLPVSKRIDPLAEELGIADRRNMLFGGTTVTAGRARGVVTDIGSETVFGQVAQLLDAEEPPTPLEVELDRVGRVIAVAALLIAVVIFGLGVARQIAAETMFLTAVALAVAAIPEGLSAIVTVTLSRGVSAMAQDNAIVRRLPAVESLGATTVICTDKTGTLTQNQMRVQQLEFAGARISDVGMSSDSRLQRYAHIAALCNDARRSGEGDSGVFEGDPTEVALLRSVDPVLISAVELQRDFPRIDEVAFDSARKRMSTLHRGTNGGFTLLAKGAPEEILFRCARFESSSGTEDLMDSDRRAVVDAADAMASDGLRTLALAYRPLETVPEQLELAESDLVLVAIIGMSDQVRPEAFDAVAAAHRAGVGVVMVTGDHVVTATAVGRQLGIIEDESEVLGGYELRELGVEDLSATINNYRIFARVDPADKVDIVTALKNQGEIVAMTGDGVNDAPALRRADVGIAMGSGTEVARESSAMILADDNFATIVGAVAQGRAIFANLQKVVYLLLAGNAAEVLVMLFGFLLFGALGEPLLATQLLWINLVTDGLPALAIGVDSPTPGLMDRAPTSDHRFLGRQRQKRLLAQGSVLAAGALATFAFGYWIRDLEFEEARTLLFTSLVLVQLFHVYNIRSEGIGLRREGMGVNRVLAAASGLSLTLHLLVVYTGVGQRLFGTTPIALVDWLVIAASAAISFAIVRLFTRKPLPADQTRSPDHTRSSV